MNLHVQVRTSTGSTVQVSIRGKTRQILQLVHLYSEEEEIKKTSIIFCANPLTSAQVYKFRIQPANELPNGRRG